MTQHGTADLWENQRWWGHGLGWAIPGLLERPAWSDNAGQPVGMKRPPARSNGWRPIITSATSPDGWQYASVFKHFEYERPGGRSTARASDLVRRRCWRRDATVATPASPRQEGSPASTAGGSKAGTVTSVLSPAAEMDGHRVRNQTETEKRKAVVKLFMGMITATIKRNQVWNLIPLDPVAWLVMWNEHQTAFRDLVNENMQYQLTQEALNEVANPRSDNMPPSQSQRLSPMVTNVIQEGSSVSIESTSGSHEQSPCRDTSLLKTLLAAAMHSRAAYGYAMQAGHLNSVFNYALLHTVHALSFDAAGGASGAANNQALHLLAGVRPEDVIMADWHSSLSRPCHYVAVDRANQAVVLSIRGSLEAGDIFSDLSASPLEMSFLGADGHVHEGLMAAATYIHSNTACALQAAGRDFPGWPLFLTGHSMGGAVASLVAMLLVEHGLPAGLHRLDCVAIGPAAVMTAPLAEAARPFVTSLVLRSDFVPRLTYAGVEGLLLELAEASPVRRAAKGVGQTFSAALESLKMGWSGGVKPSNPDAALLESDASTPARIKCNSAVASAATTSATADVSSSQPTGAQLGGPQISESSGARITSAAEFIAAAAATERLASGRKSSSDSPRKIECTQPRAGQKSSGFEDNAARVEALGGGTGGGPKRPEMLYPAGRILWVLPAEEASATTHLAAEEGGLLDTGGALPSLPPSTPQGAAASPVEANSSQWKSISEHVAVHSISPAAHIAPSVVGIKSKAHPVVVPSGRITGFGNSEKGGGGGFGGDSHHDTATVGSPGQSVGPQSPRSPAHRRPSPVVLDVDRRAFARILLTSQTMDDHLPDSYLDALLNL
mmetsp:Transcript_1514/g.4497  ORF Transcript_1514/g.4497 Transcript_1514/m.4497 type:complete len:838 (-) Transcript_1514:371-2884(-)|eukprot:CAMPEP_0206143616 /NCGR_PEP_ID=MMETSP1473-20131121/21177_1 /ASSEMBLY_ACC=CAM_ASM_001109 /TAXON_ID=1461547 /ORGANISM="Stichococcus sp, Strain RCC1054" /LENGTH=837 /DNA_ID=CAMNT_0053539101 /DNA_START=336 /DNA_END=2849 /DNA_ORIENTATION=+